jgi:hemoglobin/transferrin/lactoferrin receptor protein
VPDADASYYGTFVQAELKIDQPAGLSGELTILPGVGWDGFANEYKGIAGYEDFEDQALSKKLGLAYKPVPWLLLFGNYGEAFRAPSYIPSFMRRASISRASLLASLPMYFCPIRR